VATQKSGEPGQVALPSSKPPPPPRADNGSSMARLRQESGSNSLRRTLHAARKVFDPAGGSRYLASENESLVLRSKSDLWVDVEAFEDAAVTARRSRDPAAYRAALELYAGELLPGDRYGEWAENRREQLQRLYLTLLAELARVYEERGDYERGLEALRKAVAEESSI
jgi:DNA-binding SARP family transcriptional activator